MKKEIVHKNVNLISHGNKWNPLWRFDITLKNAQKKNKILVCLPKIVKVRYNHYFELKWIDLNKLESTESFKNSNSLGDKEKKEEEKLSKIDIESSDCVK